MAKKRRRTPAPGPWKPRFFRILLPGFHRKLSIPGAFSKYINSKDCRTATILSPLGNSWRMEIRGDDNYMYFREGWEEFCEAHDLHVGCLLVFSYEDEMVFKMTVFDSSTCMKEYTPVAEDNHMDNNLSGGRPTSLDEMEITECAESLKDSHEQQAVGMFNQFIDSQEQRRPANMSSINNKLKITIPLYCLYRPCLQIPRVIGDIDCIASTKKVILRDPKMRLWPTKVYHYRRGKKNIQSRFASGWAKFRSSNNLEEGDVCILEVLPDEEDFTIHVNILKKHMLPGASESSCQEEQYPVIRRTSCRDASKNKNWKIS